MEENIITSNEDVQEETTTKTYTEEEVLKLIQSETDKRVSQALKTQAKKHEKELSLSKLDGSEREKAEKDNRIAELEEQLARFEIERNKSELKSVLSARNLSVEFADDMIIIDDDLQASQARIERLDKLFKKAVQIEVERRLASNSPKGNTSISNEITKEKARKLSINEMNELLKNDPDKFKELFG